MRERCILFTALFCATTASAQDSLDIEVGTRVRVTDTGAPVPRVGTVTRFENDTLWVLSSRSRAPRAHPLMNLGTLELSAGRGMDWRIAITGSAVGALVGAVAGDLSRKRVCPAEEAPCGSEGIEAALGGAVVGAVIGALPAVLLPRERWVPAGVGYTTTRAAGLSARQQRSASPRVTFSAGGGRFTPMDNVFDDMYDRQDGPRFGSGPARRAQVAVRVFRDISLTAGLMRAGSVWSTPSPGEGCWCNRFWSDNVELSYRDIGARTSLWRWERGLKRELWLGASVGQVSQHVAGASYRREWFTDRNPAYGLALGGSLQLWRGLHLSVEVDDRITRFTPVHFDRYERRYSHSIVYWAGLGAGVF